MSNYQSVEEKYLVDESSKDFGIFWHRYTATIPVQSCLETGQDSRKIAN
jgi:hypothetical protein